MLSLLSVNYGNTQYFQSILQTTSLAFKKIKNYTNVSEPHDGFCSLLQILVLRKAEYFDSPLKIKIIFEQKELKR